MLPPDVLTRGVTSFLKPGDEAAARQQQAIPLADGEDYGDEFADVAPQDALSREEVPF